MLRAAITFFVLGLVAMILGASGFAGLSIEIGRTLLYVFLVLAVISFVVSLLTGKKTPIAGFAWLVLPAACVLAIGCSSMKKETDKALSTPSAESETAARQAGASQVTEVNFEKGSFVLTEGSRAALKEMVAKARTSGTVDDIKVLAWADVDYPSDNSKKASKRDLELATKRANAIRDFAKAELGVGDVDTYNMAERPNAVENLFGTSDAKVKQAFENAGVTSADGKSVTGKASHAVVMATLK